MTTKQKKAKYEKPAMQVYELHGQPRLLQMSGEDYNPNAPQNW